MDDLAIGKIDHSLGHLDAHVLKCVILPFEQLLVLHETGTSIHALRLPAVGDHEGLGA
jgi:hypothetical protein